MSVVDSQSLSQIVYADLRKLLSVTESLCRSENVCFCHRLVVSVTDSQCLSKIVFMCHIGVLYVSLCLYQTLFLIILGLILVCVEP